MKIEEMREIKIQLSEEEIIVLRKLARFRKSPGIKAFSTEDMRKKCHCYNFDVEPILESLAKKGLIKKVKNMWKPEHDCIRLYHEIDNEEFEKEWGFKKIRK